MIRLSDRTLTHQRYAQHGVMQRDCEMAVTLVIGMPDSVNVGTLNLHSAICLMQRLDAAPYMTLTGTIIWPVTLCNLVGNRVPWMCM